MEQSRKLIILIALILCPFYILDPVTIIDSSNSRSTRSPIFQSSRCFLESEVETNEISLSLEIIDIENETKFEEESNESLFDLLNSTSDLFENFNNTICMGTDTSSEIYYTNIPANNSMEYYNTSIDISNDLPNLELSPQLPSTSTKHDNATSEMDPYEPFTVIILFLKISLMRPIFIFYFIITIELLLKWFKRSKEQIFFDLVKTINIEQNLRQQNFSQNGEKKVFFKAIFQISQGRLNESIQYFFGIGIYKLFNNYNSDINSFFNQIIQKIDIKIKNSLCNLLDQLLSLEIQKENQKKLVKITNTHIFDLNFYPDVLLSLEFKGFFFFFVPLFSFFKKNGLFFHSYLLKKSIFRQFKEQENYILTNNAKSVEAIA